MIAAALVLLLATDTNTGVPPKPTKERMVCRTIVPTGSRLGGKRVCRTAAEWRAGEFTTNREVRRMQNDVRPMSGQ